MGLGEALKEEVTFDKEKVTSTDWSRYKILTMQEMPEIKVVQLSRDDKGFGGGGEAPNAVAPPAVVAAVFDATGVAPRRIPLTPAYVTTSADGLGFVFANELWVGFRKSPWLNSEITRNPTEL